MRKRRIFWIELLVWALCAAFMAAANSAWAEDAKSIVQQAVNAELSADRDDHTLWKFMQHEANGDMFAVVQTRYGSLKRHVNEHGRPASPQTLSADDVYNNRFVHDPSLQAKQKRDDQHDDKSATELLKQMPDAFLWKVEGESGD